jgi:hypothetical protein
MKGRGRLLTHAAPSCQAVRAALRASVNFATSAITGPDCGEANAACRAASSRKRQMQTAIVPAPSLGGKNAAALSRP